MTKSNLLFLALLATIPIQLSKFFFPAHSYVLGIPVDYRAVAIYFSDILILLYLAVFIVENRKQLLIIFKKYKHFTYLLLVLNIYLVTNIFFSISKEASIIFTIKIIIFSIFSVFAAETFSKKGIKKHVVLVLTIAATFQAFIIFGQFFLQRSLGLWILGERTFDASTVSIAHAQLLGNQLLRPYGTFPHPNVAAAFLLISLILILDTVLKRSKFEIISILLITISIFLTFSKTAIFNLILFAVILQKPAKKIIFATLLIVALIALAFNTSHILQTASIAERLLLSQVALDISSNNLIFGVGSNNFILALSKLNLYSLSQTRLLQPVHNIFLLILTENGIIGLLIFTSILLAVSRQVTDRIKLALFFVILVYTSVDHFLWTLQQGRLIFFLTLSYIISSEKSTYKKLKVKISNLI